MSIQICKLCKINIADKTNSHIIPKFLGKDLFEGKSNKHTILLKKDKVHKVQSTVKEDNIFCTSCENIIGKVESYTSNQLIKLESYKNYPKDFKVNSLGNIDFVESQNFNPYIFKLFIYSILFRVSICKHYMYDSIKLPEHIEEELRVFLHTNLSYIDNYKQALNYFMTTPKYDFIIFMPEDVKNTDKGVQGASMADNILIMLGNFKVYFLLTKGLLKKEAAIVSNQQNKYLNFILHSKKQWETHNYDMVKDFL